MALHVRFDLFPRGLEAIEILGILQPWSYTEGKDRLLFHYFIINEAREKCYTALRLGRWHFWQKFRIPIGPWGCWNRRNSSKKAVEMVFVTPFIPSALAITTVALGLL